MKAVLYNGPKDVSVNEIPDAKIEKATDHKNGRTKVVLKPAARPYAHRKAAAAAS
jgi:hypothetical protein